MGLSVLSSDYLANNKYNIRCLRHVLAAAPHRQADAMDGFV